MLNLKSLHTLEVSYKNKHTLTLQMSSQAPWCLRKGSEN